MPPDRIIDALAVRPRYARSVHLERDFADPAALAGYVVTPQVRESLQRLLSGLAKGSTQRAWRITGDYGSGKSSFALALARLVSGSRGELPRQLRAAEFAGARQAPGRRLLPVLVVGSRTSLAQSLLGALLRSLQQEFHRGRRPQLLDRIERAIVSRTAPSDNLVLELIDSAAKCVQATDRADGLLFVLDELGKFLEFAAVRPEQEDVYFLQRLAEAAARSGEVPVFVVGLLHQGFSAYAAHVSDLARREWEKVAGRYDELLFNQPLEQLAQLAADALGARLDRIPTAAQRQAKSAMISTIEMGWFGSAASRNELLEIAPRLYPLHPTVLPVAAKLFTRFGQNERSFFSFLLSDEPFALRAFGEKPGSLGSFYRLHNLFDYARSSMGHALATASYRSHWNLIDSLVASFSATEIQSLQVLKTAGILNLVDDQAMLATETALEVGIAGCSEPDREAVRRIAGTLQRGKRILYNRGASGGLCLWPYTSVNIERAYQDAHRACQLPSAIAPLLADYLDFNPIVARRHYIETGTFRAFGISYASASGLASKLDAPRTGDGEIVVVTPETGDERLAALEAVAGKTASARSDLLIAVTQPLSTLASLLLEVLRWEWVSANTPELVGDAFAAEEVSRQLAASRRVVAERVRDLVGLSRSATAGDVVWHRAGERLPVSTGKGLVAKLSDICDDLYPKAPLVRNELLNRHVLSSAAAAARMRLAERLFANPSAPLLGFKAEKSPPEKSMYLSVLDRGRLHRKTRGGWTVAEPNPQDDPLRLAPTFRRMHELLQEQPDARIPVSRILTELAAPPFGVRAGLAPLLLGVLIAANDQDIAVYESDVFLQRVSGLEFQRIVKAPATFSLQFCRIVGVRAAVFEALLKVLETEPNQSRQLTLLDVVRPLCVFAAKLPQYSTKTRDLSARASGVRVALLAAREPASLLFRDLPEACGFEPFTADQARPTSRVRAFAASLREAVDELRMAYPKLLESLRRQLILALDVPGKSGDSRGKLATSAEQLAFRVSDIRLKAFCMRLADRGLGDTEWLEALGSFICSKPPARWSDPDVHLFRSELQRLAELYKRVEAASFTKGGDRTGSAVRIAVTFPDGTDVNQVLELTDDDEPRATQLEAVIAKMFAENGRVAIAAASRAIRHALERPATKEGLPQ